MKGTVVALLTVLFFQASSALPVGEQKDNVGVLQKYQHPLIEMTKELENKIAEAKITRSAAVEEAKASLNLELSSCPNGTSEVAVLTDDVCDNLTATIILSENLVSKGWNMTKKAALRMSTLVSDLFNCTQWNPVKGVECFFNTITIIKGQFIQDLALVKIYMKQIKQTVGDLTVELKECIHEEIYGRAETVKHKCIPKPNQV